MDMQIIISSQGSGPVIPLQLDIPGYRLEVSGIPAGRKLAVAEHSGRVTVSLIGDAQEAQPSVEEAALSAVEAQPGAVPAVEQAAAAEAVRETAPAEVQPAAAEPEQLFQKLAALRKQISSEAKLPPYVIFHDATLKEMCRLLPTDLEALKSVQGVGQTKLEKYGVKFIEAIREYAGKAA